MGRLCQLYASFRHNKLNCSIFSAIIESHFEMLMTFICQQVIHDTTSILIRFYELSKWYRQKLCILFCKQALYWITNWFLFVLYGRVLFSIIGSNLLQINIGGSIKVGQAWLLLAPSCPDSRPKALAHFSLFVCQC